MGVLNNTIRILGKKVGMTQVFTEDGKVAAVTVIEAGPCVVLGTNDINLKVGYGDVKEGKVKKPQREEFKKLKVPVKKIIRELRIADKANFKVGDEIKVDIFKDGDFVDVIGMSIGKGFQGGMKRWNWMGTPMTHGSMSHRRIGSIGASSDPSRVVKGKSMPGHMGYDKVTVQNLKVIKVDLANNLLVIKGAVPGPKNGILEIRKSIKKKPKVK
jgi:large subunit ribosomal protein L3